MGRSSITSLTSKMEGLRKFLPSLTDDTILDLLILFESRQIMAARKFKEIMEPVWPYHLSTLEARELLENIYKDFDESFNNKPI